MATTRIERTRRLATYAAATLMLAAPNVAGAYEINVAVGGGAGYFGETSPNGFSQAYDSSTSTPAGKTSYSITGSVAQSVGAIPLFSSGTASADLASGSVHAIAYGSSYVQTPVQGIDGNGQATATLLESVTFTVPNASPATATAITLTGNFEGTFAGPYSPTVNNAENSYQLEVGTGTAANLSAFTQASIPNMATFYHLTQYEEASNPAYLSNTSTGDWTTASANAGYDVGSFTGTYTVYGSNPTISIYEQLSVLASGTTEDFSNTGYLDLGVPNGVTYRSTSGIFLSNPIVPTPDPIAQDMPEPPSIALLAVAIAVLGIARHTMRNVKIIPLLISLAACVASPPPSPIFDGSYAGRRIGGAGCYPNGRLTATIAGGKLVFQLAGAGTTVTATVSSDGAVSGSGSWPGASGNINTTNFSGKVDGGALTGTTSDGRCSATIQLNKL